MEVAKFVDNVTQFEPGESSSMCVAYSAAQIIRMVAPDQTNTSTPEDIDELADQIYASVTGSTTQDTPISVDQLKGVLSSYGTKFAEIDLDSIDSALASSCPVIVMAPEGSFRNIDGSSPYSWDTSPYDHCIVLSGLSDGGGYEVRDGANSSANPPVYQKQIVGLFSAIKVIPAWSNTQVQLYSSNSADFSNWFTVDPNGNWVCKQTGAVVQYGNLAFYRTLSIDGQSLPVIGLPQENEQYDGSVSKQRFERAVIRYNPNDPNDRQPGVPGASHLDFIPSAQTVEVIPDALKTDIEALSPLLAQTQSAWQTLFAKLLQDAGLPS